MNAVGACSEWCQGQMHEFPMIETS